MENPPNSHTFAPRRHIPRFSLILLQALKTPLVMYLTVVGNITMFGAAYLFLVFEEGTNPQVQGYGDALWWALCTVSTVGYGDIYPHTIPGRWVGVVLILVGVTFFLSFLAVLSTMVSVLTEEEYSRDRRLKG
ncbi:MAG: two pore domain potassium channel family protein [Bdellovibrionales bacterium]|nr:two pore domain potassium channel family protein [Bdellovibrionales bacterium]